MGITATDDSMQLVGDVDLRDSASDVLNTGIRVSSSATITDLPDTMRVDYSNTPTQPFRFTWRADAGIALANGVFDVLLPAPTALVVHGAFETGAVGAGALPPAADLLVAVSADQTTPAFLWSKPAAPTDTFPTAVVPAFDPSTITRVHAGAEISTLEQRNAGSAIRGACRHRRAAAGLGRLGDQSGRHDQLGNRRLLQSDATRRLCGNEARREPWRSARRWATSRRPRC